MVYRGQQYAKSVALLIRILVTMSGKEEYRIKLLFLTQKCLIYSKMTTICFKHKKRYKVNKPRQRIFGIVAIFIFILCHIKPNDFGSENMLWF